MQGVQYPVDLIGIDQFEAQNEAAINLFEIKRSSLGTHGKIRPLRISNKEVDAAHVINMLLIWNGDTSHYVLIQSLSALLSSQISNSQQQHFFCPCCLRNCTTKERLERHRQICTKDYRRNERLPVKGSERGDDVLTFKNLEHCESRPYIILADFETVAVSSESQHGPTRNVSSTTKRCP